MKVYDSFGTFDQIERNLNLTGQVTNIGTDNYIITNYYDISNDKRFALLAILQTVNGDDKDLSKDIPDCAFLVHKFPYTDIDNSYLADGDKRIGEAEKTDEIHVIVHHAIGFDPATNPDDNQYIKDYKSEIYTYYPRASKPGAHGTGILL